MRTLQLWILAALVAVVGCSRPVPEPAPVDAGHVASAPLPPARDAGVSVPMPRASVMGRALEKMSAASAAPHVGKLAPPDVVDCARVATDKASLMACLGSIDAPKPDAGAPKFALSRGPVPPSKTSWLVPQWHINPSTGNDNNACTTSGAACKTYAEIVSRWETQSPTFRNSVAISIDASQTATTDRIYFTPAMEEGATSYLQCQWTQVASGTLSSVVAKSLSNAEPRLQANLGSGASTPLATPSGLWIVNTTRGSSGAPVSQVLSGTTVAIDQPQNDSVPTPPAVTNPFGISEVDTWANGDAYLLFRMPTVYLASFEPTQVASDASANANYSFATHCYVPDPAPVLGTTNLFVTSTGMLQDSWVDAAITTRFVGLFGSPLVNTYAKGGATLDRVFMFGGELGGVPSVITGVGALFENNVTIDGTLNVIGALETTDVQVVGNQNIINAVNVTIDTWIAGSYTIWTNANGIDQLNVQPSTLAYQPTTAAATFLGVPTLYLDGYQVAIASDLGHGPMQSIPGIALTLSNLDTSVAAGGFGSIAHGYAGSVIEKWSTLPVPPTVTNLCGAGNFMTGNPSSPCAVPPGTGSAVSSVSASGAGLTCSPTTGAVVCSNTGVTSVTAGSGITVSPTTGAVGVGITAPIPVPIGGTGTTSLTNAFSQTHSVLIGEGTSPVGYAGPATAGFPLLSAGATTDPSFGTLTVGGGGTSVTTLTAHAVVVGEGTSAVASEGPGTTGQPLLSGGASADPAYGTLGANFGGTGQTSLTSNALILGSGTSPVSFLTPAIADTVVGTTNGTSWSSFLPLPITSFGGGSPVSLTSAATYFSLASFSDTSTPTRTYSFIGNLSCSNAAAVRIKYGISVNSTSANTVELTMDIQGGTTEFNTGGINFAVATSGSNTFRFLAQDTTTVSSTCNGYLTMIKTVQ